MNSNPSFGGTLWHRLRVLSCVVAVLVPKSVISGEVLFSKLLLQGRTVEAFVVQVKDGDTLVFDPHSSGRYVLHGLKLIVIAAVARVDSNVVIDAFDDTDIPGGFSSPANQGQRGANGRGTVGGNGNPGQEGQAPSPLVAETGRQGSPAKEVVLDIAQLTGAGRLVINNVGGKGGAGQKGGKGGTGGQGAKGADGSDSAVSCLSSGGNAGIAGQGGTGGTGGIGGPGGKGGLVYLSTSMFGQVGTPILQVSVDGGLPGEPGSPGEGGDGGASQDGGSGSVYCGGGRGTGRGKPGATGSAGAQGAKGAIGQIAKLEE